MKTKIALLFIAAALLAAIPYAAVQAQTGQGWPVTTIPLGLVLNGTAETSGTVAASGSTAFTSQAFNANAATGFAVIPSFEATGTTASAVSNVGTVTFYFSPGLSNTGYSTTTKPIALTSTLTGTTPVLDYINVAPNASGTGVANAPYWYLSSVANSGTSTAGITINSITISTSNR